MRDTIQERSPHAFLEDYRFAEEWERGKENPAAEESFRAQEEFIVLREEGQTQASPVKEGKEKGKKENEGEKLKKLLQYFSTVAVTGAATVTLTVGAGVLASPPPVTSSPPPVVIPQPSFSVEEERISYNGYQCLLKIEEGAEDYRLVLQAGGATVQEGTLPQGQTEYAFVAEGLSAEAEYTLRALSAEDEEVFSYDFTTDPFVVFGRTEEGRSYFTLHEDITLAYDVGVRLYGKNGEDYSSLLYFDPQTENYLYLAATYQGEYTLELTEYPPDVEEGRTYRKQLTTGTLIPLSYELNTYPLDSSLDASPLNLMFTYQSGDLLPYTIERIELQNPLNGRVAYSIEKEYIGQEGDWITAQTVEAPQAGNYRVLLYGACMDGEYSVETLLWQGEITV